MLVDIDLDGVPEILVHQQGSIARHPCLVEIGLDLSMGAEDLHPSPPEDVGRPYEDRQSDGVCGMSDLIGGATDLTTWHPNPDAGGERFESLTVACLIDGINGGPDHPDLSGGACRSASRSSIGRARSIAV